MTVYKCSSSEICFLCTNSMYADLPPHTDRPTFGELQSFLRPLRFASVMKEELFDELVSDYECGMQSFREGVNHLSMYLFNRTFPVLMKEAKEYAQTQD